MWFIGVEVEQETSAPPAKKNPGSTPGTYDCKTQQNATLSGQERQVYVEKKKKPQKTAKQQGDQWT